MNNSSNNATNTEMTHPFIVRFSIDISFIVTHQVETPLNTRSRNKTRGNNEDGTLHNTAVRV